MNSTMLRTLLFTCSVIPTITAFSSWSVPPPTTAGRTLPNHNNDIADNDRLAPTAADAPTTTTSSPWRLVLDIGREPLSSMPFDWARSGCRMPLVIPCDFCSDQTVLPRSDVVSFTGPNGAVEAPIQGGTWSWDHNKNKKDLSLTLTFPKDMARRDVTIEAGTTIQLSSRVFTQTELDQLNDEFYQAREQTWKIGGELNERAKRQEAPKKWNEETQQWEKRYNQEPILSQIQKQTAYWKAQMEQKQKANQRPNLKNLSTGRGSFPGYDGQVFVQKEGVITIPGGGGWRGDAVIGKWSAEPITNNPVSYKN